MAARDKDVTLVVVGQTGSGKSTFINVVTNYFRGGTVEDLKVAVPNKEHPVVTEADLAQHTELNIADGTASQTTRCTSYAFTDAGSGRVFNIIDTPGLSDTRGTEADEANVDMIVAHVAALPSLTGLVLVVNGKKGSRLTVDVENTLVRLRNAIPDAYKANIFVVCTRCRSPLACEFDLTTLPLSPPEENVYFMDNCAFQHTLADIRAAGAQAVEEVHYYWATSMDQTDRLVTRLAASADVDTEPMRVLVSARDDMKRALCEMRVQFMTIQVGHV
jgi:GTP-binding protein EngB required for normal cell division